MKERKLARLGLDRGLSLGLGQAKQGEAPAAMSTILALPTPTVSWMLHKACLFFTVLNSRSGAIRTWRFLAGMFANPTRLTYIL